MKLIMTILTLLIAVSILLAASIPARDSNQLPFGNQLGETLFNYNRTTPFVATSGAIADGGIQRLKELAEAQGLLFDNIPIDSDTPSAEALGRFTTWVEDETKYPTLLHCASANRVGLLWGMYRHTKGVSLEEALLEAQTIGIEPSSEKLLLEFARRLN